jgi:hypothetical protein
MSSGRTAFKRPENGPLTCESEAVVPDTIKNISVLYEAS